MQNVIRGKLKVLDLFSGIGMFSYGLHQTGLYETTAFCEWDEPCRKVLSKNFPGVQIYGDISNLWGYYGWVNETYDNTPGYNLKCSRPVDVIVGGFPCQDISNSGPKTGLKGERSKYWYPFLSLIEDTKPKGVIIENVSSLAKRGMGEVLKGLSEVGYDAEWHVIPAYHCGAIHKRSRVFIIAYPSSIGQQESWRPLEPFNKEETRNSEANLIKHVLQGEPMPYMCRDHAERPGGVDRLKQLGNTVYWPIVERLGYHLHDNLCRMSNTQIVSEQTTT